MANTKNIMCHFHAQGKCRKGEDCPYSHDLTRDDSLVCKYFIQGHCTYGDRCHFDHIRPGAGAKPERRPAAAAQPRLMPPPAGAAAAAAPAPAWAPPGAADAAARPSGMLILQPGWQAAAPAAAPPAEAPAPCAWAPPSDPPPVGGGAAPAAVMGAVRRDGALTIFDANVDLDDPWEMSHPSTRQRQDDDGEEAALADVPLCEVFLMRGECPGGDECPYVHGDLCPLCETFCLHPFNAAACEQHEAECLSALDRAHQQVLDSELECVVCMERVLEHPIPAHRKFGLMGCDHVFCLGCIRSWRCNSEADLDKAVRTCPVCRTPTNFVTPSTVWPTCQEHKDEIIDGYKQKLASIHCRHFDYGRGTCPFSTSCFYRHEYEDGTLQDREAPLKLRTVLTGDEDGPAQVLQPISLGRFLDTPSTQRLLRRPVRR